MKIAEDLANLLAQIELQEDLISLKKQGLTEEEIQGYLEFFIDSYVVTPSKNNLD